MKSSINIFIFQLRKKHFSEPFAVCLLGAVRQGRRQKNFPKGGNGSQDRAIAPISLPSLQYISGGLGGAQAVHPGSPQVNVLSRASKKNQDTTGIQIDTLLNSKGILLNAIKRHRNQTQ